MKNGKIDWRYNVIEYWAILRNYKFLELTDHHLQRCPFGKDYSLNKVPVEFDLLHEERK